MGKKVYTPSISKKNYLRIIAQTIYYFKSRYIQRIYKIKSQFFTAAGGTKRIDIFSNSLEYMGALCGHRDIIRCLSSLPNSSLLASGSRGQRIKVRDLRRNRIKCTLYPETKSVSILCYVNPEVLVGGLLDNSLVVLNYRTEEPKENHYIYC